MCLNEAFKTTDLNIVQIKEKTQLKHEQGMNFAM